MKKIIILSIIFCQLQPSFAQHGKKNVTQVTQYKCPERPFAQRPVIMVSSFAITAPTAPKDQLGDNLTTMLNNALQQVNCYSVRTSAATNQQNSQAGDDNANNPTSGASDITVTGELDKYDLQTSNHSAIIVTKAKSTATIGVAITFNMNGIVLDEQQVTITETTDGSISTNIFGNPTSTTTSDPSVQKAAEKAIDSAVAIIARDNKIPMPENTMPANGIQTTITIEGLDDGGVHFKSEIKKMKGVYSVSKEIGDNITTFVIDRDKDLDIDELIDEIQHIDSSIKLKLKNESKDGKSAALSVQ